MIKKNGSFNIKNSQRVLKEKFSKHYDDSSDEESTNAINRYPISTMWQKKKQETERELVMRDLLSFTAHAAGLKLLYSPAVNSIYYPMKNQLLTDNRESALQQLTSLLEKSVDEALLISFNTLQNFITIAEKLEESNSDYVVMLQNAKHAIKAYGHRLIQHYMPLFIENFCKKQYRKFLEDDHGKNFLGLINAYFKNLLQIFPHEKSMVQDASFVSLINKKSLDLLKTLEISQLANRSGIQSAIEKINEYSGEYAHFARLLKLILKKEKAAGFVKSIILKQLQSKQYMSMAKEAFQFDIKQMLMNASIRVWLNPEEIKILKRYYVLSQEKLMDQFEQKFTQAFMVKLEECLQQFSRPTLPKSFVFFSHDPYGFYANLRLSNRSQKRKILNHGSAIFRPSGVVRTWNMLPKFSSVVATPEIQQLVGSHLGRKDLVPDLGAYEQVSLSIEQIKTYFKVSDKTIACWLRDILKGIEPIIAKNDEEYSCLIDYLHAIAYLLFGCEVARNPAMAVVNQMLLDLIIGESGWTFAEIFSCSDAKSNQSKVMPMAPKGSVSVARSLESNYRSCMPKAYAYPGVEEKAHTEKYAQLIKREADIVEAWLHLKDTAILKKLSRSLDSELLLNTIEKHFEEWFEVAKQDNKMLAGCSARSEKSASCV